MMLETVRELCNLNGISGRENRIRDYIISKITGYCEYKTDPLGNLLVFKKGKKAANHTVLIDAHMDEVGMIVTGIDSDGCIRFAKVGGVDSRVIIGRNVYIGENCVPGVLGIKPIHLIKKSEEGDIPSDKDLYIDIGAKNKEDAEKYVMPGDEINFESNFSVFGDGFLASKALDDRAGCAVLIDIIRSETEYDCRFSFSVQEEIGTRGAATAAFSSEPDYAIVVETTTAADICGIKGADRVCICGEGGAVSFMDRSTVYNRDLYLKALETAKSNGIKAQTKTRVAGGNDAGAIHKSRGGVKTITVSVPCRYLHSPCCVCKLEDIESTRDLVKALATEFAK